MEISFDPYEQKLYHMFKSHDTECTGTLDETSLIKLCNSLELHDQRNVLVRTLVKENNSRVSFKAFKEALLNFLGTEMESSEKENQYNHRTHGAPDSPGREISPKLIMGAKKYGRRSRPQSIVVTDSSQSDSDTESAVVPNVNNKIQKVQRSSSQSEIQSVRRRRPNGGTKLKRCASLPTQKNQKARDHLIKQQTSSTQAQLASSVESLDTLLQLETVPSRSIIEMWEAVKIGNAKSLLSNLGFDDDEVNISQLLKILEEELRGVHGESQNSLLKATLTLRKAEIASLQQSVKQLIEENRKLLADNKEANRRAAMLAQEIDERHANLEDLTKSEIRMLEQRHAEVIRDVTSQLAIDRENWSALNSRLESRIKTLEENEARLKMELQSLQDENCALEKEQVSLQKQMTDLLEANIKLNNEIVELEERQRSDDGNKGDKETEEVLELIEKITSLQVENSNLRDKNDELVAELESLETELSRFKNKKGQITRNTDVNIDSLSDDPEHSCTGLKRRGDSPSKTRITEESPRLGKFRKCSNDNSESETSGDWMTLNSDLNTNINNSTITPTTTSGFSQDFSSISNGNDEETRTLKEKIFKLENEIKELKESKSLKSENTNSDNLKAEKERFEQRCLELENSLEQMRKAYEDCEDYWQNKLNDERQLFEKERQIYEDEQHESDKKFSELMDKVREYEEQFSKEGRLSPIEEKDTLEQQYADLETEITQIKETSKRLLEEKTKEISVLQDLVQELKCRLGEDGNNTIPQVVPENTEVESSASSPISYLWNQSTIQIPARDYQNPNWNQKPTVQSQTSLENPTTSDTTVFSTAPNTSHEDTKKAQIISPIQKPVSAEQNKGDEENIIDETASNESIKSFEANSITSIRSIRKSLTPVTSTCSSPSGMKEELKRLKYYEMQLKEQIQELAHKRDSLIMELQQLQEAKPVLEKAYARAAHPTLLQRVQQLEQKNRHLQTVLRQQQQYTESIMHQTWQQQRSEIAELRSRLETQGIIITEQAQRLANSDLLVKDLYVENSHLTATIQRLEQQRSRNNLIQQHQSQGLRSVPGMP